ncbi:hypothetical protein [Synechococcus sp. PCC 6312]|uniref:hypothetical protein n=1 Tax=Synechococcus sp. (strain ATCC 27167 / PCC 6312) TaxID=195253 RepID=UPI00029EE703|nr:hypothetical protein [Synechococcus sp. PCC 6312]AFY62497.1 hypothetical protein Syn6312_3470 [Synechococcus sp. PCC 6312]
MMGLPRPRLLVRSCLMLPLLGLGILSEPGLAQSSGTTGTPGATAPNVEVVTPALPAGTAYTIAGGKRLIDEAATAVNSQNYVLAARKLLEARTTMNQLSNYYQSISSSFLGIDAAASDSGRRKALESAQMRDIATYQLALVYRANNQPELAIPLLVEILRSQNPTRELGQKSYQQLVELGFMDVAFPRGPIGAPLPNPTTPSNPASATPATPSPATPAPAPTPAPPAK